MYELCMDELSTWPLYIQNLNIHVKTGSIWALAQPLIWFPVSVSKGH